MTEMIPDEITHLDFEPEEEESCIGYAYQTMYSHLKHLECNTVPCSNAVKLYGVRRCCGQIEMLCLGCYNLTIKTRTAAFKTEHGIQHVSCGTLVTEINPFMQVQFK